MTIEDDVAIVRRLLERWKEPLLSLEAAGLKVTGIQRMKIAIALHQAHMAGMRAIAEGLLKGFDAGLSPEEAVKKIMASFEHEKFDAGAPR